MSQSTPRLLVIAGSAREGSLNTQLAAVAAHKARALGAETTTVDLRALDLPVYDQDVLNAQGMPEGARRLRQLFAEHDGLLLSSPEYNALPTPLFINAFDWLSVVQAEGDLPSGTGATAGKPVGLMAASPGALGGHPSAAHRAHLPEHQLRHGGGARAAGFVGRRQAAGRCAGPEGRAHGSDAGQAGGVRGAPGSLDLAGPLNWSASRPDHAHRRGPVGVLVRNSRKASKVARGSSSWGM